MAALRLSLFLLGYHNIAHTHTQPSVNITFSTWKLGLVHKPKWTHVRTRVYVVRAAAAACIIFMLVQHYTKTTTVQDNTK